MSEGLAWVDGALVPRPEARVSIDDFGLRYGLTCFETMLARHGRVFRLARHLDRLEAGLRLFRVPPPARAVLERAVAEVVEANALDEASVRLSVTPGVGGRPALPATGPPTVIATAERVVAPRPVGRLHVASVRLDRGRPWRGAKVGQFAPYLLARVEAAEAGADDALLLDHEGYVAEAATANVFAVVDGGLVTPALDHGALPGVTREAVVEAARAAGIAIREASVTLQGLRAAAEVFLTSSVAGVQPVQAVTWDTADGLQRWRPSPGSAVTGVIREAYERLVEAEGAP